MEVEALLDVAYVLGRQHQFARLMYPFLMSALKEGLIDVETRLSDERKRCRFSHSGIIY